MKLAHFGSLKTRRPFVNQFINLFEVPAPIDVNKTCSKSGAISAQNCNQPTSTMKHSLRFRKLKVALNPMYRIFFKTLPKVTSYPAYQNSVIRKHFTVPSLKAEIKGVFSRS